MRKSQQSKPSFLHSGTWKLAGILAVSLALAACNPEVYGGPQAGATVARVDGNPPAGDEKINLAKRQFREQNFGLSEKSFRAIVETQPRNAEAWLGLAASYDQLRRFKLADRAYKQVTKLDGPSVALHNNRGFSYLLRGDRRRARREFLRARGLDPKNQFVRNNLKVLARQR